ncbi:MAG: hypothetical protein LBK82_12385 [Planctomycetaceae bacterium]|nr:hypothetical protein [Planctomycetaceae bacterium]
MPIRFALLFQSDCWGRTVTHRVAVGYYALPLQGGGKNCNPTGLMYI